MRQILFLILLAVTTLSQADITLKYGRVVSDQPDATKFAGVWLEQDNCNSCLALFGIEFINNNLVSNRVAGIDFTQKIINDSAAIVQVTFGYSVAEKQINDSELFNFHLGGAFIIKNLLLDTFDVGLYYDHLSNGRTTLNRDHIEKNEPIDMVSIGLGHRF